MRLLGRWPGLTGASGDALVEDCLVLLEHLGGARTLVDVGSGGGMPGIPLQIARPQLRVTLVEADRAKAAFLVRAAAELRLPDLQVLAERAETVSRGPLRESFDVAVCRALGALPVVAELCLPLVRVGGRLLAMRTAGAEVDGAWERLGGGRPRVLPAPSRARERGVVAAVDKVRATPAEYPRRPGVPARRPLRALQEGAARDRLEG